MKNMAYFLTGVLLVAAIAAVQSMSYADEVAEETYYCQNVNNDVWPDFKELGEKCSEQKAASR